MNKMKEVVFYEFISVNKYIYIYIYTLNYIYSPKILLQVTICRQNGQLTDALGSKGVPGPVIIDMHANEPIPIWLHFFFLI